MAIKTISGVGAPTTFLGLGVKALATGGALVAIWVAATLASLYSPDMISGSNQEHLQLVTFLVWPLAAVATGMVLLAAGVSRGEPAAAGPWTVFAVVTGVAWLGAALTSIFASPMVTGTDPTTIPVASIVAPFFAALVTAYASIYIAGASKG